jgi:ferric-dicitrate binding protein FerR (iron transport regulator)
MRISEDQFRELLNRYLKGTASPAERELLDNFFDSYKSGEKNPDLPPPDPSLRDKILKNIHSRGRRKKGKRLISLWLPIAAAISVFVIAYFFLDHAPDNRHVASVQQSALMTDRSGPGQRLVRQLPDGTTVHLNSGTTISYPKNFGGVREVTLTGEAFFEVVHNGKPFVVHAGNADTHVLGTSFNVKCEQGEDTRITLVEGKVNVIASTGESLTLEPNEQALVDARSSALSKRSVNVLRYVSWKDNVLFFEQTSLGEAVTEIEKWYGVDIDIANPAVRRCVITAKYDDEPLGNVLGSLQFLLNLKIKRLDNGHYVISGKGCR